LQADSTLTHNIKTKVNLYNKKKPNNLTFTETFT